MAYDPETGAEKKPRASGGAEDSSSADDRDVSTPPGILARMRNLEARMDRKLGIESEAIVRKRAEDKKPVPWTEELNMALLWASGTMNTSCFATGFLGWQFGLSLKQSILITIFMSILGGAVTGYCATFGAATGLRQMSAGRFSFGWWPSGLIALLNCIQQMGWSAVSCITGGLALSAVSDGRVSLILGIVILAVVALVISLIGLNAILVYERFAWMIFLVIFLIIFGETGRYADNSDPTPTLEGAELAGPVLSLMAIVYGSSASWAVIASDYYVHYPANISRVKVFLMTTFGIAIPTTIGMVAGCVVASTLNNQPAWKEAYGQDLGYLINEMLYPAGFAKFLLAVLVLSGINTNVLSIYSAALSFQQLAKPFAKVPRFIWTLLSFVCILALAVGGREQLNAYLQNFLSLLGYWCTSYAVILFEEHFIFRKGSFENYDLDGWNDPERLPHGIGASVAFGLGVIAWVMGMNQTWYRGPLAGLIGTNGGDVANELTFVVTAVAYIPARYLELQYFKR